MSLLVRIQKTFRALGTVRWLEIPVMYVHYFTNLFPNDEVFRRVRCWVLMLCGVKVKKSCRIGKNVYITHYGNLTIGEDTGVGNEVFFDTVRPITIGKGCNTGFRACYITGTHQLVSDLKNSRPFDEEKSGPIVVKDFVWVGANATILPGVTIGRGAVVAAGALVTADVEDFALVAGVPAKKIKSLEAVV